MDLVDALTIAQPSSTLQFGVVTSVSPFLVSMTGNGEPAAMDRLSAYSPTAADDVVVLVDSIGNYLVLGTVTEADDASTIDIAPIQF